MISFFLLLAYGITHLITDNPNNAVWIVLMVYAAGFDIRSNLQYLLSMANLKQMHDENL